MMLNQRKVTLRILASLLAAMICSEAQLYAGVYVDLGRPCIGAWQRKAWLVFDPVLKKEILWSQESSQDGAVFYALDIDTGKVIEEHDIPAREVGGILPDKNGVLYLYTYSGLNHPGNELLRFDPKKRKIERLGLAKTPRNRCVDGVIGRDGNVYIGTHQQGRLFRFDTAKEFWSDLGQMVPAKTRSKPNIWLRNLHIAPNGKLLGAVVTSPPPQVVEIDATAGSFRTIETLHSKDFIVYKNRILVPTDGGFAVYDAEYRKEFDVSLQTLKGGKRYGDARLELESASDNAGILAQVGRDLVRIDLEKKQLNKIAILPFDGTIVTNARAKLWRQNSDSALLGPAGLKSRRHNRAVVIHHPIGKFAVIDFKTKTVQERKIGYVGKRGTQICGLNKASNGSIYGTNIIGMHIFRYDPKTNKTHDLGHVGWQGGEVYNVIDVGGKIYFGTYGGGHWGVYDPKKPWRPDFQTAGRAHDANPRNLGQLGGADPNAVNRPFEYATLNGKIYIAARANYGHRGGSLVEFDTKTEKKRVFRDRKRSVQTVTAGDDYIYGGTSIRGGRGSGIHAEKATVFIFEPKSGKRLAERRIDAKAVVCVRYNKHDRLVYATTDNQRLLALDAKTLAIEKTWPIRSPGTPLAGVPEDAGMIHITVAADGDVYGVTSKDLFRLKCKKGIIEYLDPPPIPNLYQIVEGEPGVFYIGAQTHLLKYYVKGPVYYR